MDSLKLRPVWGLIGLVGLATLYLCWPKPGKIAPAIAPTPVASPAPAAKPAPTAKAKPAPKPSSTPAKAPPAPTASPIADSSAPDPTIASAQLVISLSQRQVSLYEGTSLVKRYPVAIGRDGWETPTGRFQVMEMLRDPNWINPLTGKTISAKDPNNPLAGYWIGFWTDGSNWVGFHGTPDRDSVGQAVSHGCVRMYKQDIEELFNQVTPGTPVIVRP